MEADPLKKYAHMDFPMVWKLNELRTDGAITLEEALAKRKSLETSIDMNWRMFAIDLVIGYEQFALQNHVEALEALAKCLDDIKTLKACGNPLSTYSPEALEHVVVASRGFILAAMPGLLAKGITVLDECFLNFKEQIKVTEFQSALIGIRSAVFMAYGVPGARKAQEYIGEALKLDNNVAEWHFLYGKCMGRLRRIFTYSDTPSEFELQHHKLAVKLTQGKVPYYIVYVAQCQREMAFRLRLCEEISVRLPEKSAQLFDQSAENYNKAYRMAAQCSNVLTRCALGFLKLPVPYGNATLAHNIMGKVIGLCPENPMRQHIWALINERGIRDPKAALISFQKAAEKNVFVGWKDLIRLTYLEYKFAYNPTPDLKHLLSVFTETHFQDRILVQIGSFYLFQENYLFEALKYIMEVFNRDPHSQNLTVHRNVFMGLGHPINLVEVIFDECRLKCAHPKTKDYLKKRCKEVIILWSLMYPELLKVGPKHARKEILQESYLYTHPWARSRGRPRHKTEPMKKSKSKAKSSARDHDNSDAVDDYKQEPEFKPYVPESSTILKGWLTVDEQLAKHKSYLKWKSGKNQRKNADSPRRSANQQPRTYVNDSKTYNWRQQSVSRGSSVEAHRPRAESAETPRGDRDNSWRKSRDSSEHRATGQPQLPFHIPRSQRSDSCDSETGSASLNWRTECLSVETGIPESKEKPMVPESSFSSQNPRQNRAHWSNTTSSIESIPEAASVGWPSLSNNSRRRLPLRSTSYSSDNRNWRSGNQNPTHQRTNTAEGNDAGNQTYQRRTSSNTRDATN